MFSAFRRSIRLVVLVIRRTFLKDWGTVFAVAVRLFLGRSLQNINIYGMRRASEHHPMYTTYQRALITREAPAITDASHDVADPREGGVVELADVKSFVQFRLHVHAPVKMPRSLGRACRCCSTIIIMLTMFIRLFVGGEAEVLAPDKAHQHFVDEIFEEGPRVTNPTGEWNALESQRLENTEASLAAAISR
jgi:hypothetical protein